MSPAAGDDGRGHRDPRRGRSGSPPRRRDQGGQPPADQRDRRHQPKGGDRPRRRDQRPSDREPREAPRERSTDDRGAAGAATERPTDPPLPPDVTAAQLDHDVRSELRTLPKPVADTVARHLVAAGTVVDEDPADGLAHAMAARRRATRIAAVREAVGLTAYRAGEWQTAVAELRTYHRMVGQQPHLAVLADCERALGRPERALEAYRSGQRAQLPPAVATELLIVAAGARADLGHREEALAMLAGGDLTADRPGAVRLRYAYADALLAVGRTEEARDWFSRVVAEDEHAETDAAERLLDLEGIQIEEVAEDLNDEAAAGADGAADERPDAGAGSAEFDPAEPAPAESAAATGPAPATDRLVGGYDLVILDLDGVVLLGEQPIPVAVDTVAALRRWGPPVLFATNNASRSPDAVAQLLTRIGVPAAAREVVTSAAVAATALADRLAAETPVLVVGADALAEEVRRVGLRPVRAASEQPAAVVQGFAPGVDWAILAEACLAVRAGAQWVVTNTDATLPSPRGPLPGNGSLVATLRTALGRDPDLVVGKPAREFFTAAARRVGAGTALVVGDRLDTDVEGAQRAGMESLLVLTGVTDREQAQAATPPQLPDFVAADLAALLGPAAAVRPAGRE